MSRQRRVLDLYCGVGGAARGYDQAGFEVVGVDIEPQPNYRFGQAYNLPYGFVQADALESLDRLLDGGRVGGWTLDDFDVIHASPPCQRFTAMGRMANTHDDHPDLVAPTRELLEATGKPYVIENVEGAPLRDPLLLCGTMFGLGILAGGEWYELQRHRLFESNVDLKATWLRCKHGETRRFFAPGERGEWYDREPAGVVGVYGGHLRNRSRADGQRDRGRDFSVPDRKQAAREALEIQWARTWHELDEAVPPAYTMRVGAAVARAKRWKMWE